MNIKRTISLIALVIALTTSCSEAFASMPHYSQSYNKRVIHGVAVGSISGTVGANHYHHLSNYQADCLIKLAYRESSWRNWVTTGECHGLFQLSSGMAHGNPWWMPRWNTDRAIHYISVRYGTPANALAHSLRHGWY